MTKDLDALPLPDPLALLHTGDDFGGERDDPEIEFNGFNAATEFCLSKPAKTKVGLHTDDALRDYGQRCYELAMRKAQEGREQTTAQGKINAELDTDSNTSESQQRRHMAGSLEVGQLVGDRQDSRSGDIEPQGEKSLERWLCGIMKPIAEDIAKNCSTAPQLVIAPLIWGIEDLLKSGALFTSPPPKSDEARDAERYRWLRENAVSYPERPDELELIVPVKFAEAFRDMTDAAIDAALAAQQKGEA